MSGSCSRGHVGSFATLAAVVAGLGSACVASTGHSPAPSVVDPGRSVVADACLDCHSEVGHAGKPDLSRGLSPELALRALRMVAMGDMPPPSVSTLTTQARGAVIGYLCRSSEYGASYCAIAEAGWAARRPPMRSARTFATAVKRETNQELSQELQDFVGELSPPVARQAGRTPVNVAFTLVVATTACKARPATTSDNLQACIRKLLETGTAYSAPPSEPSQPSKPAAQ